MKTPKNEITKKDTQKIIISIGGPLMGSLWRQYILTHSNNTYLNRNNENTKTKNEKIIIRANRSSMESSWKRYIPLYSNNTMKQQKENIVDEKDNYTFYQLFKNNLFIANNCSYITW